MAVSGAGLLAAAAPAGEALPAVEGTGERESAGRRGRERAFVWVKQMQMA